MFFPMEIFQNAFSAMLAPLAPPPVKVPSRALVKLPAARLTAHKAGKKSDEFLVSATRDVLLRSTTSLTKISTACHNYCSRLSHAFTVVRFMEAMSALTRPFFPMPTMNVSVNPWLKPTTQAPLSPWVWWMTLMSPDGIERTFPAAAPFMAVAPKREIEGGIAMAFAALTVAASVMYTQQFSALVGA